MERDRDREGEIEGERWRESGVRVAYLEGDRTEKIRK